jgi:2-methylcitrate dehydratase PrpD
MPAIIEELVDNILGTRYDSFDEEVVNSAKKRVIDVIGCLIGGANAPGCSMITDLLISEYGGNAQATVLVHGGKVPAQNAAMLNCIMARSYDFEVCCACVDDSVFPSHISATTVPTALSLAEQKSLSGGELITALILGDDIASRVTAASDFSFDVGWDTTGTINVFGSVAIAGRLLGLNREQLLNAFGIALNEMAGSFQGIWDGVHCFKLYQGFSARAGIFAAQLASRGFTGVKDPLLGKYGYFSLYCPTYHTDILNKDLGEKFYAEATFKPYPGCRCDHSAIDATLKLVQQHNIEVNNIEQVTVGVSPSFLDMFVGQAFELGEVPQISAAFNLRYHVANALVRKSMKLEHFTEELVRDPKVVNLAKRIELIPEVSQASTVAVDFEKTQRATVKVKTRNGKEFFASVDIPKGDPIHNPLSEEEIKEKFRTNVAFSDTVGKENAEKALNMLDDLQDVTDVSEIIMLLVV